MDGSFAECSVDDVDVDDVDDDEEGAGAYFFLVRHSDGHTNCELHPAAQPSICSELASVELPIGSAELPP